MRYLTLFFIIFSSLAAMAEPPKENEEKVTTLSEMGIDFGAAELGRYAKLGLSDEQKREALDVVKGRKPKIEKLCDRMTEVLEMQESTLEEKKAKERELTKVQSSFKAMQKEIISKLHELVTADKTPS